MPEISGDEDPDDWEFLVKSKQLSVYKILAFVISVTPTQYLKNKNAKTNTKKQIRDRTKTSSENS